MMLDDTKRLTDEEIEKYIKPKNEKTGVDAITKEMLSALDLDKVMEVVRDGDYIRTKEGEQIFKLDRFTPRSNSYAFKPSFAGSQILMGREGRELYFSNGVWFSSCIP